MREFPWTNYEEYWKAQHTQNRQYACTHKMCKIVRLPHDTACISFSVRVLSCQVLRAMHVMLVTWSSANSARQAARVFSSKSSSSICRPRIAPAAPGRFFCKVPCVAWEQAKTQPLNRWKTIYWTYEDRHLFLGIFWVKFGNEAKSRLFQILASSYNLDTFPNLGLANSYHIVWKHVG